MGQILTWIRGPRDGQALQDVAVEEQSQPSQATPKPAAQVSTVKPAQFEKASSESAMATKPGVTTATGGATGSGVTAGGGASVGTAGKAKAETNTTAAGATVIDMSSAGATLVDMTSAGPRGGPREMSKTAAVSQAKATATVPSPAAGAAAAAGVAVNTDVTKPKESPKDSAKSATATTIKADVPKVDSAKTSKPIATAVQGKKEATQTKVQVEVPPAAAKGAKEVDPLDALANILPSAGPFRTTQPVYTGPEVVEQNIVSEKMQKCGERDSTLPPGYRFADMAPAPVDVKPKDVPKPLSTDEALDSLSFGFTSSTAPAAPKKQEEMSAAVPRASMCPPVVPPADKKAKMEKVSADFSLEACLPAATKAAPPVKACQPHPADKKDKMVDTKPKTDGGDSMSLDALSALVDTLPEDKPEPELPKLRPEYIVSEDKVKQEKGVRVGERDETLPPKYRFNSGELKKLPAPKPEPTMGTADALDILSGDFMDSSSAPAVHAPPAKKDPAVPPVAVCPPADKNVKKDKMPDDFSLEAATATKVESSFAVCPPAGKKVEKTAADNKLKTGQSQSFSLDALSALSDTLPADFPKPESPKLRPEDLVSEEKHKKEKGVLVGERDDTIAPEYRFKEDKLKKLPAPKPEPTMGTADALDILSGDFTGSSMAPTPEKSPAVPPVSGPPPAVKAPVITPIEKMEHTKVVCQGPPPRVKAPVITPVALPAEGPPPAVKAPVFTPVEKMEHTKVVCQGPPPGVKAPVVTPVALPAEKMEHTKVVCQGPPPGVKAPVITPVALAAQKTVCAREQPNSVEVLHGQQRQAKPKTEKGDSMSLDALGALGDMLPEDKPEPELPKLRPEDMVSEEKHKKQKGVLVGERDDTIAPEYRFKEDNLKKLPAPKSEPSMDSGDALDILSGDFTSSSSAPVVQAITPSAPPAQPSEDFALDALAGDFVSSTAASTVQSAACVPTDTAAELSAGAYNALDSLSDTLKDIAPTPQPAPLPAKDIVKEKKAVEERLIKLGERDDSLPPEYRPTAGMREAPATPKGKAMDDKTALDLLSSDFTTAASEAVAPAASSAATQKLEPPVLDSQPLKPMSGPVLDSLSGTLLPGAPEFKPKTDKPKGKSKSKSKSKKHHGEEPSLSDQLPAQPSSDVVPKSTKKGGKS